MPRTMPIATLSDLSPGQEADLFLLMTVKEELKTKTGKPYFRVGFRDGDREVSFPIWGDSPWAVECRDRWNPGVFYKLRGDLSGHRLRAAIGDPQNPRGGRGGRRRRVRSRRSACRESASIPRRCSMNCWPSPEQQIKNPALRKLVESLLTATARRC